MQWWAFWAASVVDWQFQFTPHRGLGEDCHQLTSWPCSFSIPYSAPHLLPPGEQGSISVFSLWADPQPNPLFRPVEAWTLDKGRVGCSGTGRGLGTGPHLFVFSNGRSWGGVGFKRQNLGKRLKIKAEQNVWPRRQSLFWDKKRGSCKDFVEWAGSLRPKFKG